MKSANLDFHAFYGAALNGSRIPKFQCNVMLLCVSSVVSKKDGIASCTAAKKTFKTRTYYV